MAILYYNVFVTDAVESLRPRRRHERSPAAARTANRQHRGRPQQTAGALRGIAPTTLGGPRQPRVTIVKAKLHYAIQVADP